MIIFDVLAIHTSVHVVIVRNVLRGTVMMHRIISGHSRVTKGTCRLVDTDIPTATCPGARTLERVASNISPTSRNYYHEVSFYAFQSFRDFLKIPFQNASKFGEIRFFFVN